MNASLKNALVISAKNAVRALMMNSGLALMIHHFLNFSTKAGLWNIGKVTLLTVVIAEAMFWGPIIKKWANSNGSAPLPS